MRLDLLDQARRHEDIAPHRIEQQGDDPLAARLVLAPHGVDPLQVASDLLDERGGCVLDLDAPLSRRVEVPVAPVPEPFRVEFDRGLPKRDADRFFEIVRLVADEVNRPKDRHAALLSLLLLDPPELAW